MLNISSIDRNTLKIAIPLIISNITIPLVGFVDNVMMGHLGSVIYIGAIGVGAIIISYILFSFGFIKSLTTGFVSQHSGSKSDRKLLLSLAHLTLIASFISIVIIFFRQEIVFFKAFKAASDCANTSIKKKDSSLSKGISWILDLNKNFISERDKYFKNWVGSPTRFIKLENLTNHLGGAQIWSKVVSDANGGAHKIYNATVHCLMAKRSGKKVIILSLIHI